MPSLTSSAAPRRAPSAPALRPLLGWLSGAAAARRQRQQLARLDDALLRDIGLTRAEALGEAERPLWDVPQAWRR